MRVRTAIREDCCGGEVDCLAAHNVAMVVANTEYRIVVSDEFGTEDQHR